MAPCGKPSGYEGYGPWELGTVVKGCAELLICRKCLTGT